MPLTAFHWIATGLDCRNLPILYCCDTANRHRATVEFATVAELRELSRNLACFADVYEGITGSKRTAKAKQDDLTTIEPVVVE